MSTPHARVTVSRSDGSSIAVLPRIEEGPEVVGPAEHVYPERRADGWPYCPLCGEDELWSDAVPATEATIVGCYACGWEPIR